MQSVALRARVGVSGARSVARPARRSVAQPHTGRFARLVAFSTVPEVQKKLEEALKTAEEKCAGETATPECAVAWDEVEELAAAASHKKDQEKADNVNDPLEQFCEGNPDADECRVYED